MRGSETRLCCRIAATRLCLASSLTLSRLLLPSSSLALSSSSSRLTPFPTLPHPSAPSSSRAPASHSLLRSLPPTLSPLDPPVSVCHWPDLLLVNGEGGIMSGGVG
ncbi:unnamed protein product [Closterium sp. NIES-64]|nr:unnamed protein product [Closterium sp. NIES-64]